MAKRKYIVKREKGIDEHFKLVPATWYESIALCLLRLEIENYRMRNGETPIFTIAKKKYECLEEEILKGLDTLNDGVDYSMKTEALKYYHGYYDNHCYSVEEIREKLGYDDVSLPSVPAWHDIPNPYHSLGWYFDLYGLEDTIYKSVDFRQVICKEILAMLVNKSIESTFLLPILNRYEMSISCEGDYETDIRELELTVQTFNCLYRAGITTTAQLLLVSEEDLHGVRNLGKKQIKEVLEMQKKILYKNSETFVVKVRHINQDFLYTYKDTTGSEIARAVYKVIVNEILQSNPLFDYPMPLGLEDFLLLKGYLLINDVLKDSTRLQNELQTIGLNEWAAHLAILTKAISEYKNQEEEFCNDAKIEILELSEFSKDKLIKGSEEGKCLIGRLRTLIKEDNEYLEKCKEDCKIWESDTDWAEAMRCEKLLSENNEDLYTLSVFSDEQDYILIEIN